MEKDHKHFIHVRQAMVANPSGCNPDKKKSPTFRRVFASVKAVNALLAQGEALTPFKKVRLNALFHAGLAKDEQCMKEALLGIDEAMLRLSELIKSHPEAGEKATDIVQLLVSAYDSVLRNFVLHQGNREMGTIRPLVEQNTAKAAAVERAKAIATELWQADTAGNPHRGHG